ncbi:MAG: uroporphyrinogen decarboxylase family protein [Kiritimatiellia bacterium]|jgi:uroporphyrinogen decarboxylase
MQTPREVVQNTIAFTGPDRFARDFPDPYGCDFAGCGMRPSPDDRPPGGIGVDEWGSVWDNIGVCQLGEVKRYALPTWDDLPKLRIPDFRDPARYAGLKEARKNAGDRFLLGYGVSMYERIHFIRGLENTWCDIYEEPEKLCRLIDLLADMNLHAMEQYASAGVDGFIFCDDWGLQDRLMIAPETWRTLWKPRYARVFGRCRELGLRTFLHSCGYIVDILDDLIEIGLDVIHMDQQENMGLETLGERFRGRLAFYSPVDIQHTMARGNPGEIRAYCRRMADAFATPKGGFLPRWYTDPKGAGHTREAIQAMCEEFRAISHERYGD